MDSNLNGQKTVIILFSSCDRELGRAWFCRPSHFSCTPNLRLHGSWIVNGRTKNTALAFFAPHFAFAQMEEEQILGRHYLLGLAPLFKSFKCHLFKVSCIMPWAFPRCMISEGLTNLEKNLFEVWWILFLLLLTPSASTCLPHSPNYVQRLFSDSVQLRLTFFLTNVVHFLRVLFLRPLPSLKALIVFVDKQAGLVGSLVFVLARGSRAACQRHWHSDWWSEHGVRIFF